MFEGFLVLFGLATAAYVLLGPLIAMLTAGSASRRAQALEKRVLDLEVELARERAARRYAESRALAQPTAAAYPEPAAQRPLVAPPQAQLASPAAAAPQGPLALPAAPQLAAAPDLANTLSETSETASPAVAPPVAPAQALETAAQPPPPAEAQELPVAASAPTPPPVASAEPSSLEEQLGLTWLTRIGAGAFVLGALFFFKYAVDNEWIGPLGRVAVGGLVGLVLLALAELTAARSRPSFVQILTGIGLAVLFAAVWSGSTLYGLFDPTLAFIAATVVLLLGAALALRRKGELILIVTLLAGFANPIVLSTGQDRPTELFGYLLLITSISLFVATRLGFRYVPWLAVLGTTVLFGGWYVRFFDIHDLRDNPYLDAPEAMLVGAYYDLGARVVPLCAAGLFAAEWVVAALFGKRNGAPPSQTKSLGLAGLVLAHGAAALLLYDTPRLLAFIAIGLAIASIVALTLLDAVALLLVPMGAAFLAFVVVSADVSGDTRATLVTLLGVWTFVYLLGFVRGTGDQLGDALRGAIDPKAALRAFTGLGLFVLLATLLLVAEHASLLVLILAMSSFAALHIALRSGLVLGLLGASVATATLVLAASGVVLAQLDGQQVAVDPVFLGATALWALTYVVTVGVRALRHREVNWTFALTGSIAVLAFLGTALLSTGDDVPTLRALLTAASGVVDLAFGLVLLRAVPGERDPAAIVLGQALALFAAALAFGLSGAPVTVLWAALGAVCAAIAARTRAPIWLGFASLFFFAALIRLGAVDVVAADEASHRYFSSLGREGSPLPVVVWNPRAYSLFGISVAALLSGWLLARGAKAASPDVTRGGLRAMAMVATGLGYLLLITLAISEARSAFTDYPAFPTVFLDNAEWYAFSDAWHTAMDAQQGSLSMLTTLILGLSAAGLLVAGFAVRDAFHRIMGLVLFVVTVAKLALWDVWNVERLYQIILLTGVGALLVAGGFLYARFGARIVALMREDDPESKSRTPSPRPLPPGAGPAALALILLAASSARAEGVADLSHYEQSLSISGISAPGDYRFDVDVALYQSSKARELLADLRIQGPDGVEVPYVLQTVSPPRPPTLLHAILLDPGVLPDGGVEATFSLTGENRRHCRAVLQVDGDTFLRRVRVETAENRGQFALLSEGAYVYRVPAAEGRVENLAIDYPASEKPYLRITLLPGPSPKDGTSTRDYEPSLRIQGADVGCYTPDAMDPVTWVPLPIESISKDPGNKRTIVSLDAGTQGIPLDALRLNIETAEFSRQVSVKSTAFKAVWPDVGGGIIYRVAPREGFVLTSTRLPISQTRKRWYQIVIDDEDSPPLVIRSVEGEVRNREVILRASAGGAHTLYVGNPTGQSPYYDLKTILDRAERDRAPATVSLGPASPSPLFGAVDAPKDQPWTEQNRTTIGVVLGVVLVGLALWTMGLLRKSS